MLESESNSLQTLKWTFDAALNFPFPFEMSAIELLNQVHKGIWVVSLDGTTLFVNQKMSALMGYPYGELVGRSIFEDVNDMNHNALKQHLKLRSENLHEQYSLKMKRKDGSFFWAMITASPISDKDGKILGSIGIFTDVTEQLFAQEALEQEKRVLDLKVSLHSKKLKQLEHDRFESEERLRLALDMAQMGVWDWNVTLDKLTLSDNFKNLLHLPHIDTLSMEQFLKFVHPDDRERVMTAFQKALDSNIEETADFRIILPNQSLVWMMGRGRKVENPFTQHVHIMGASLDISDRKKYEQLLEESTMKLMGLSKMSALGEMAGGIAHEINNPLTIIRSYITLVNRLLPQFETQKEKIHSLIQNMESTCIRIADIIEGLRFFARDASQDHFEKASLQRILTDTLAFCQERFRKHQIELTIQGIPEDEILLYCRPVQISQAILNLLNNAHDALEDQSGDRKITISLTEDEDYYELRVANNGTCIPPEIIQKIFEPFFTTKSLGKGTGMGLSISKGIIESHQGRLYASSSKEETCFHIQMPKKVQLASATAFVLNQNSEEDLI